MITVFRKEIKYVIPVELYFRMERQLDALMERDTYGKNGTYTVRSQYFDSIHNQDLWDNLDGVMEKRKIRLRVYTPQDTKVKLEYKCKSGSDGVKYSLYVTREEAARLEAGDFLCLLDHEEPLAIQLYHKMITGGYQPRSLIEYDRTAFAYPVSDVRITFDENIRACARPYGFLENKPFFSPVMQPDMGVLEVKYNDFLPAHLKEIVRMANDQAEASSKYSRARLAYF